MSIAYAYTKIADAIVKCYNNNVIIFRKKFGILGNSVKKAKINQIHN